MRILQLGKFYPIRGGVEKVMYDLMLGLSEKGIDCDMMCTTLDNRKGEVRLNANARLILCRTLFVLAATTFSPMLVWRLRRMCNRYDIIHVHHPDPMAALALFLSGYRGKVVLHWHSDVLKQRLLLPFFMPLQNWIINRADTIVGTTQTYVESSPFLEKVKHKLEALPIGVEEVAPSTKEVDNIKNKYQGKKIVYSIGRLVEYKGYTHLIDAASHLTDEYVILIGGDGKLRDSLQQQINNNGLSQRVKLLGLLSDMHRDALYGAADIFCLSSVQKTEAFAIVQIEAMSCGTPIVATNIPGSGVPWVNEHSVSGINVEPENGKALAEAIMQICESKEVYDRFAQNAKMRYATQFTYERMIDDCIAIYGRIGVV